MGLSRSTPKRLTAGRLELRLNDLRLIAFRKPREVLLVVGVLRVVGDKESVTITVVLADTD